MIEKCSHPAGMRCEDIEVLPEIEAGSKALYQTSINLQIPDSWIWLTPHIRNRWRWRFQHALKAYEALKEKNGN